MKTGELIDEVREAAKKVYEKLGGGFRESVYRDAMLVELETEREIPCIRERSIDLYYEGQLVGRGVADLLVGDEEKVIVELKRKTKLAYTDRSQLGVYLNSLKKDPDLQGVETGLLINFQYREEEITKRIEDEPEITLMET